MIGIGLFRGPAGYGTRLCVDGLLQGNPTIGRQGKSAASGRAHMVGWLEFYGPFDPRAGWRFGQKPQRFQRRDRRRCLIELICMP
jgi:hypothetical protein